MLMTSTRLLQIFLSERTRLCKFLRRIVGNAAAAEDLAHDALLRLWHRPFGEADRGLLFTTARNLAIDHIRAEGVRERGVRSGGIAASLHAAAVLPDAALAERRAIEEIGRALESLPDRTRQVFLLNRLDGMTYHDIAGHLGISVSTVEKDMIRALLVCREIRARHEEN